MHGDGVGAKSYDTSHVYADVYLLHLTGAPLVWRRIDIAGPGPESLSQLVPRDFRYQALYGTRPLALV